MYTNYPQTHSSACTAEETEGLGLLQHLDKDDLQRLLDNSDKLDELVQDSLLRRVTAEKETLLTSNKSLAEYNLSLQPKLDNLKQRVATGYEEINTKKTQLGKDKAQLDSLVGEQSLDTMLALLQTEAAKSEETSEAMAEDFLDNKITVEEFLNTYITKRIVAHTRRVKVDKMTELLRDMHVTNHPTLHQPQRPAPVNQPWGPQGVAGPAPYPTNGSFRMPQPAYYAR